MSITSASCLCSAVAADRTVDVNSPTPVLAETFLEMTTKREFAKGDFPILKWEGKAAGVLMRPAPTHISSAFKNLKPALASIFQEIASETGFGYGFHNQFRDTSVPRGFILFGSGEKLLKLAKVAEEEFEIRGFHELLLGQARLNLPLCAVGVRRTLSYEIIFTLIAIEDSEHLEMCVAEEFFQSMGFANDLSADVDSVIGTDDRITNLTDLDKLFLRALYGGQLKAGQSPDQKTLEAILNSTVPLKPD